MPCLGPPEPIAVIGSGCRFPGRANSPSQLWTVLKEAPDLATKITTDRFNPERFYHPDSSHHGTCNATESYLLDQDIRRFDAGFFAIPPAEAAAMDPQHRLLMETVYEAIEASGLRLSELRGSDTAVYVGITSYDYFTQAAQDFNAVPTYNATGAAACNASARLSYFFDWHGPCMTIDTACSSSMVAVAQAVQTLRLGTSRVAVAAGTNLLFSPMGYISYSNLHMLSPTGRCQMWDADADGYVRGEGVASLLLKRLSDAIADGDQIDFVIREVGVNQDGRTRGITMPSAFAQAQLIRETYAKAGLDPHKAEDRCQYFEAHGTGTPVGDPQEAEALKSAFFPDGVATADDVMHVGSIKTVIGHTESTAGIAGMLKAALAMKHGTIPPNQHFKRLNPSVAPFYANLKLVTSLQSWPDVALGQPKRASVNSFGFGGTNSHAIIESYEPEVVPTKTVVTKPCSVLPLVFSAASTKSLHSLLRLYHSYLESARGVDLRRLALTLACRRTPHPCRVSVCGGDYMTTSTELNALLAGDLTKTIHRTLQRKDPAILGVFTGQGAQWPQMGASLIRASPYVRNIVAELEESLQNLPEADRPTWSILDELQAAGSTSRVAEAALAQPLTCALQLILIDLLQLAGVRFRALVGHSSGELGAAHAAGFLTRHDAIRIAYYRGLHSNLACGTSGQPGGMLAAGLSLEEGRALCARDEFHGRITVAAANSSTSITLSGDADAVAEMQQVLESGKKFVRALRVDKAYHSHHMLRASEPFLESLRACKIKVQTPSATSPRWFSSVLAGKVIDSSAALDGQYWNDNLNSPVLFSQAIQAAIESEGPPEAAVEVGAHNALQGPASEVYASVTAQTIPIYVGCLSRAKDDVATFSKALGTLWTAAVAIDFERFDYTVTGEEGTRNVLQDLPLYPWDHDTVLWSESRKGRLVRQQSGRWHALLGTREADGTAEEWHWRNFLTPKELPWLADHALEGQLVFPVAGYVSLGLEAAMQVAGDRAVQLLEMTDVRIQKGIAVDEKAGTELLVSLTGIKQAQHQLTASFTCFSTTSREATQLILNATASVRLSFGEPTADILDSRRSSAQCMRNVEPKLFYDELAKIGYTYGPSFCGIASMQRGLGYCNGTIVTPTDNDVGTTCLFHPAMLDAALQGLLAAFSYPGDGRLWSLHAPSSIKKIAVIPALCGTSLTPEPAFDCTLTDVGFNKVTGDVEVYQCDGGAPIIFVEGVDFIPFSAASRGDDKQLFARTVYDLLQPDGECALAGRRVTQEALQKGLDCERVAFYFLRMLHESTDDTARRLLGFKLHHNELIDYARRICETVKRGEHAYVKPDWRKDSHDDIQAIMQRYGAMDPSLVITSLPAGPLQIALPVEGMLLHDPANADEMDNFCERALDFTELDGLLSTMVKTVSHRFPNIDICEVGAGGGRLSERILANIGTAYSSYTYTDIKPDLFQTAQQRLAEYKDHMEYKLLDITSDPLGQSFGEGLYDVVVAANVFHVVPDMESSLRYVRRLLKPGGYLFIMECVDDSAIRLGLVMGCLPYWWVGKESGHRWRPSVSVTEWNTLLTRTGFSGVNTATPVLDPLVMPAAVMVSQAVDQETAMLTNPSVAVERRQLLKEYDVVLIGGHEVTSSAVIAEFTAHLQHHYRRVIHAASWQDLTTEQVSSRSGIIILGAPDLRSDIGVTDDRLVTVNDVLTTSRVVMWVTLGAVATEMDGFRMMSLVRSVRHDIPQSKIQMVRLEDLNELNVESIDILVTTFLSLEESAAHEHSGASNDKLWTFEPDVTIRMGKTYIPRIIPDRSQNDRYNSARREIHKKVALAETTTTLSWDQAEQRYDLHESASPEQPGAHSARAVQVSSSLLSCVSTSVGRLFFSLGVDLSTGERVFSASTSNASQLSADRSWSIQTSTPRKAGAQYLALFLGYSLSEMALATIPLGSRLLVHEPDPAMASVLDYQLSRHGRQAVFTTSSPRRTERAWIRLHTQAQHRHLQAALPDDVCMYLDLSSESLSGSATLGDRITASLSSSCRKYTASGLLDGAPCIQHGLHETAIHDFLVDANSFVTSFMRSRPDPGASFGVPLSMVTEGHGSLCKWSVVDWYAEPTPSVRVQPVHYKKDIFHKDKTYWLVGLAGAYARSLCDYMVSQGARCIALSSCGLDVNSQWIAGYRARGVDVACLDKDTACGTDLVRVHMQLSHTRAPLAGMVVGSLASDEQKLWCSCLDDILDWYIVLSSISSSESLGQLLDTRSSESNKALIRRRRARGVAGSFVQIPPVIGLHGNEEESASNLPTYDHIVHSLHSTCTIPISEPDLHHIFVESIVAGYPRCGGNAELITGIAKLSRTDPQQAIWANDPMLSHFVRKESAGVSRSTTSDGATSLRTKLKDCLDAEQVRSVLTPAFLTKLQSSLMMSDENVSKLTPLIDLGVDSLVAVELRGWFAHHAGVEVAVMKLLGGSSAQELVDEVLLKITMP